MLRTRILAALVFTPAILALVWFGDVYLLVACWALAVLMQWEFQGLVLSRRDWGLKLAGYAIVSMLALGVMGVYEPIPMRHLWPLTVMLAFLLVLSRPEPLESSLRRVAFLTLGPAYCGALIAYLFVLRQHDLGFALMALLCTWGADTGAYFSGRALGRRRLYPSISPNKTVEGFVGGMVCSVLIAWGLKEVLAVDSISVLQTLGLGAVVGLVSVPGDLSASMLKRSVGAKDSSALIPGHGGILDRFDGVIFAAPAAFFYLLGIGVI